MNQEEVKTQLKKGVAEFNQQQFYPCHDTLEAIWMEAPSPEKTFYQGILQIAVGCYHLSNCNWRGAVILLAEGSNKLKDYQPSYHSLDVNQLYAQSTSLLKRLQAIEPEKIAELLRAIEADVHQGWPQITLT